MDPSANATTLNPLAEIPQLPHGVTMENTYGAMLLGTFFSLMFVEPFILVTRSFLTGRLDCTGCCSTRSTATCEFTPRIVVG